MRRRRRKSIVPTVLAVLLVLVLACALVLRFVFVVRNVDVSGDTGAISSDAVIRAADVGFGTSVFRVDADQITRNVSATGVLRAESVQVQYPDTVRIAVQPRVRMAMALHLGKIRVLDAHGCLIESLDVVPEEGLVYVSGMNVQGCETGSPLRADADQMDAYCAVMQALLDNNAAGYVSELKLDDVRDIRIITRMGVTVELGDAANMADKIAWMKGAAADLENRGQTGGTLDVRSGTKADYRAAG